MQAAERAIVDLLTDGFTPRESMMIIEGVHTQLTMLSIVGFLRKRFVMEERADEEKARG